MFAATPLDPFSEKAIAAQAGFSIDDYGKADEGPYQIVMPTYPAPVWLRRFAALGPALRECSTLCALKGKPFRVVRWGREGSGARGGIPCRACARTTPNTASRFPRNRPRGLSGLEGCASCEKKMGSGYMRDFPNAHPVAEFRKGQRLVFNAQGVPKLVGRPNYVVSHNPFPRTYKREIYPQQYLEAVRAAQVLTSNTGKRLFVVAAVPGQVGTPVAVVDPQYGLTGLGGLGGAVVVRPVSPEYFQELVAESRGRSYLGQGA
jgi:hypothetical protein